MCTGTVLPAVPHASCAQARMKLANPKYVPHEWILAKAYEVPLPAALRRG